MLRVDEIEWSRSIDLEHRGYPNIAEFNYSEFCREVFDFYDDYKSWIRNESKVPHPDQDIAAVMMQIGYVKGAIDGLALLDKGITEKIRIGWDDTLNNMIVPASRSHPLYPLFIEMYDEGIATGFLYQSPRQEQEFRDRYYDIPEDERARSRSQDEVGRSVRWMKHEITPLVDAVRHGRRYKTKKCDHLLDFPYRLPQWGLIKSEHPIQRRMWMIKAYIMSKDSRGTPVCLNFED